MWALATTKPNAERSVENALVRRGVSFHVFRYRSRTIKRGKIIYVLRPVFPRYIFVPFASAWTVRHEVEDVLGLVCFGSDVARVPPEVVDGLVKAGTNDVLEVEDAIGIEGAIYRSGDRVVAVVGPLVGQMAIVVRRLPSGKIRCEFDFVGKHVFADLPAGELRLVERAVANRRRRRY
jgi:transcription antitermination factor NusG